MRSIRVSHILLSTEDLANTLLEGLKDIDDPKLLNKMFAKMAKKYSACGTRDKGGDLGFLEYNSNAKELEDAAMATPVGKLGGPIQSKFGYHIFLVTEEERMDDLGIDGLHAVSLK
ncbi:PpiC-type peptidyl-prolyl cis-trans isomerase [Nitrospina gracilis 3/211]|uniref:PpiC-type peptidyl-prolyl cis-trans isomerase n=1 Tax=Nitrospina gracilis (strain 3/211) TaxID=1266370 RepID=M1Z8B4_NITG3|nr:MULTISPECIES: peptidylprolyl isomerase [Nitrospina]MCF8722569.1 parvulin-like peptidyl-prolyl isomerase [Nitrospina sp. Nb-3]CCQ89249.1 PpiC-type peptidyl-prolyl cis-trans isomerase [Nitrospina gracilis 3/211]